MNSSLHRARLPLSRHGRRQLCAARVLDNGPTVAGTELDATALRNVSYSVDSQLSKANQHVITSRNAVLAIFSWPGALAAPTSVSVAGSFNSWANPIPLRKLDSGADDFVRSVVLPPGPVTYKFIVDGEWQHSPRDPICVRAVGDIPNNQRIVAANAVITWQADDRVNEVFVTGSFLNWQELVPLQRDASGDYFVNCCLPAGKHYVQFLVDGQWFVSPDMKQEEDDTGRMCNCVEVNLLDHFHIFYKTDWSETVVKWRHVGDDGRPATDWEHTHMTRTQSRGANWVACCLPAARGRNHAVTPTTVEFVLEGPSGQVDQIWGQQPYRLSGTGGYKLDGGVIKPFPQACAPPIMLVSDLDGTMVGESHDADEATAAFRDYWENVASLCNSVLVYNTGRSIGQFTGLFHHKRRCMALPDAIITAVGTKIFFLSQKSTRLTDNGDAWVEHMEYARMLDKDWDLNTVRQAAAQAVSSSDRCHWLDDGSEHPHRIALNVHADEVERVRSRVSQAVTAAGHQAQFVVSGIGEYRYLDILSIHGGKMKAMEYVRRIYDVKKDRVLTAGDSGNDILMLEGTNPAIVVGNAQPALLAWTAQQQQGSGRVVLSDKPLALGILEGLARHGLY